MEAPSVDRVDRVCVFWRQRYLVEGGVKSSANGFSLDRPPLFACVGPKLQGRGVAGTYPLDVAETKVLSVHERARRDGYPLRAGVEEA